jgi:hypothetical protein
VRGGPTASAAPTVAAFDRIRSDGSNLCFLRRG